MAPRYGRAYGKERAIVKAPYQHGCQITMISAISVCGVESALYGQWAANGDIFVEFLQKCLCPVLTTQHVVVMDNVSFHKSQRVADTIKNVGAEIVYLPPYSPELNPIEEMWSKIKNTLRKLSARTLETFQKSIKKAFKSITQQDLLGWFTHAGY